MLRASAVAALLLLAAASIPPTASASAAGPDPACDRAFQPAADSLAQMTGELGLKAAALVLRHHGRVVCTVYLRNANPSTPVLLVSAAKWLSAATILTLVDEGRLRLDDSVSRHLRDFTGAKRAITLRQLLSHTSGIPPYHPCMFRPDLTMDQCARAIGKQVTLSAAPGTSFQYGGAAFTVAGRMAEVADGRSWEQLFQAHMAQPLGLTHTSYGSGSNPLLSEGTAYATAEDYATFLQMILDGGVWQGRRVLSEAMVEELTRNQIEGAAIESSPRGDRTYGLGCWRDVVDSVTGRAVVLTSPGAGGFVPWINRKRDLVGVVVVMDRLERIFPRVVGLMVAARDGAVDADAPSGASR